MPRLDEEPQPCWRDPMTGRQAALRDRTLDAVRTAAGFVCMMVAALLAIFLIAGASDDSLSGAQALVMLAAAVGLGWLGWRLLGYNPAARAR